MRKLYFLALLVAVVIMSLFISQPSYAISPNVVISQVQLGDATSASNEFIEVYNNSSTDVEITNWCLYYASATSIQNGSKLACFLTEDDSIHLFLPSNSFAFAISNQLAIAMPTLGSDLKFSAKLSGTAGHVRLVDGANTELDKIGWGATAVSAEGASPATVPPTGKILSRKMAGINILQDTNVNSDDFEVVSPRTAYTYGSVYEVQDICINLDDIQSEPPAGYSVDVAGNCSLPVVDACTNLDGLQTTVPDGFTISGDDCVLNLLPLQITELLPNVVGSDDGNEFIEIYNPNGSDVSLENYVFYIGTDDTKAYSFPDSSIIKAGQYMAFYNDDIKFTLVNTTSSVRLKSADGNLIDDTPAYTNPSDGVAWALIDNIWQYTDQPTPGSVNMVSLVETDSELTSEDGLLPCADNQYRNPETNRCKTITTTSSTLTPCRDGQYRSEETNRCRSIASDVVDLVPCAEGQERNPETNRCRSVAAVLGASTLTPCKTGQERNPDTNRCRNITSTIPQADYAPEQTTQSSNNYILWWSLAGVGAVAIGYGVWEWRVEIIRLWQKLSSSIRSRK